MQATPYPLTALDPPKVRDNLLFWLLARAERDNSILKKKLQGTKKWLCTPAEFTALLDHDNHHELLLSQVEFLKRRKMNGKIPGEQKSRFRCW